MDIFILEMHIDIFFFACNAPVNDGNIIDFVNLREIRLKGRYFSLISNKKLCNCVFF